MSSNPPTPPAPPAEPDLSPEDQAVAVLGVKASEIDSARRQGKGLAVKTTDGVTYAVAEDGGVSISKLGPVAPAAAKGLGFPLSGEAAEAVKALDKRKA